MRTDRVPSYAVHRSARPERLLTGAFATIAALAGLAALLVGLGAFGTGPAGRPLLDPVAVAWLRTHLLTTRIGGLVLGAVLLVVGLVWLLRAVRPEPRPRLRLGDDLTVTSGAVTEAIRQDAEAVPGVGRAKAVLVGPAGAPALRLTLWLRDGADLSDVWAQVDEQVLSRARAALELDRLPTAVHLELDARDRQLA